MRLVRGLQQRLWKAKRFGFGTLYRLRTYTTYSGCQSACIIDGPDNFGDPLFFDKFDEVSFPRMPLTRLRFIWKALFGPLKVHDLHGGDINWSVVNTHMRQRAL